MARRKQTLPTFEAFEAKRWHEHGGTVMVTAEQVATGLLKIKARKDINPTPVNVAAVLLVRLEDMRTDALKRVKLALQALKLGDEFRAIQELLAIEQNLPAWGEGEKHGVRVTHDMSYHASQLST